MKTKMSAIHRVWGTVRILTLTAAAVAVFSPAAQANVSLKNGNFFVVYTDIFYPGGFEPKIERVYNSKASFKGMFGHGWGNDYEVYLSVSVDGSVVVHEYGGGAENRFSPLAFNPKELDSAVEAIIAGAKANGQLGSPEQTAKYRQEVKSNASFRNKEWENLRKLGKMQARQLPNGMQLRSNRFSYQYLTKVPDGYVRTYDSGRVEKFDLVGRLRKISDKNGNFIDVAYGNDGHIQKITDNLNRKIFFSFNAQGLVKSIDGEDNKHAEYQYNPLGELVYSKDVDGNTYGFKYSSDQLHNLTEIAYTDKTTMQMAYFGNENHDSIKSVKDRDGTLTEYGYDFDHGNRNHYSITTNVKGADRKLISSSKYEYFIKAKADGETWTYKLVTTLDGDKTETIYNECCGLPLLIKHGAEETAFEYDVKGHVTKKITPNEITELQYDQKAGKVSHVAHYSKLDKKENSWSTFQYDEKANLVFAKNSEGKGVKLIYDSTGRIRSLLDQDRRRIDFKYNENSKPIEITDPAVGTITVSYTKSGEIKKVDSSAGRKIAVQVTSAFQNLLDIIRPAGVTLSF